MVNLRDILVDIHALEEDLLGFERQSGSFLDQAAQGMQVFQQVAESDLAMGLAQAKTGQAFEPHALQEAVAAFGEVAPAIAFVPGVRAVGHLAGES